MNGLLISLQGQFPHNVVYFVVIGPNALMIISLKANCISNEPLLKTKPVKVDVPGSFRCAWVPSVRRLGKHKRASCDGSKCLALGPSTCDRQRD